MPEHRDKLLQHYQHMREELLAAIHDLTDEQMTEHSLDGWSITDHLAHLAFWDDIRASEIWRISAGHASAWRMSSEQDDALNQLGYSLRQTISVDQAKWELSTSHQRLVDAIASAIPRGLDPSHYGEAGLRSSHETQHTAWIRRWRAEKGF